MEMFISFIRYTLFVYLCTCISQLRCSEPKCSAFDYEEKLLEKMVKMEFEVKRSLDEMQSFRDEIKSTLEDLREEKKTFKQEIDAFRQSLDAINAEGQNQIEENMKMQESAIVQLMKEVGDLKLNSAVQSKAQRVEFRTQTISDKTLEKGQAVVFRTVDVNKGQGYNSNTGYFTAPVAGTYLLMVQICILPTNYIFLEILVDDITQNAFQASAYHFNYCVTWMTLADMHVGSRAAVKSAIDMSSTIVFQDTESHQNHFSGVLLYEK